MKNEWLIGILNLLRLICSELEDAVIMRIQALFIRITVLEFGNAQHFAGCGCSLRL